MSKQDEMLARVMARGQIAQSERARVAEVRALGSVPPECGPAIPVAPARGPVTMFQPMALYPKGVDDFEFKPSGFDGRNALRVGDAFDVMNDKAARHDRPAPFTPGQVAMGRHYRTLVERYEAAGVRCSSLEGRTGGGSPGSFMDAVLADGQRIDMLRKRIGSGSALVVRRRPSARGSRVTIFDRRLCDMVCLNDATMSDVLRAHGWAIKAAVVADLRAALADILDRMMGPKPAAGVVSSHFGSPPRSIWDEEKI